MMFAPSFLLYGFHLLTSRGLLHQPMDLVSRLQPENLAIFVMRTLDRLGSDNSSRHDSQHDLGNSDQCDSQCDSLRNSGDPDWCNSQCNSGNKDSGNAVLKVEIEKALTFTDEFKTYCDQAKWALQFTQIAQRRNYNKGRLLEEHEIGEQVLINPHSLELLQVEKASGRKLFMKYDGSFEIQQKLSPTTYWLCLPASYGIHLLDPIPIPISDNQHPALDRTRLISSHRASLNPPTFNHANSIQVTSIINACSALIADAIRLTITLSLALPELVNPLHSLLS